MENAKETTEEILIIDETGYDIEWFLCYCPDKNWTV